jgi:acetylornithine deacetylase/succinyl-diaminopimelate desuccinylase-like protein
MKSSLSASALCAGVLLLASATVMRAQSSQIPAQLTANNQLAHDIFKELIEINTTDSSGSTTKAADAMAVRLKAAGFTDADLTVIGPHERKGNLIARMRGRNTGRKPLLLLAHLDVVEAKREDWSLDPFKLTEQDGYYYGRGTTDDKAMAAIFVANMIRMKQDGYVPDRDIILALTADEEGGSFNGVSWLIRNHRELVDAEYGLNEGGGGQSLNGRKLINKVGASEKVYLDFTLQVKNSGGHSSLPKKDNAIYHLADGLARLEKYDFPVKLSDVTRAYFERMSQIEAGPVAADMKAVAANPANRAAVARLSATPLYNALMRTTCVATRVDAGHANNALPQSARANVNCRILPGESPLEVQRTLVRVLADEKIAVTPVDSAKPSPPSPLKPEVMQPIERVTAEMWPGVTVVPVMGTGATDGLYFRQVGVPVYGVSGLFGDVNDSRAHGKDERMGVKEFYEGQEFLYRLVKALSSPAEKNAT